MPEKKLEIGIIGLGKFGLRMASTLVSLGHTVVGIDMSEAHVQRAEEVLESVYKADATNIAALRSLHVQDLDWVVISVGQSVEQSLNITLNVQELGGPRIWVKASNEEHRKILQRLRVHRATVPETEAAVMAAHQLTYPGMLDLIPKYGGIAIQELRVEAWDGKTLVDLNLMKRFNVMVMGIRPAGQKSFIFVPPAMTVLHRGDTVVVAGRADAVADLEP
ncbi:MAG: TrkA family potassium uptake protein [Desulfovibrio sp.]|uniref:potassium channel family protein n=1 Tax=uncultured Desulfovibrio sp. TaxID=167968 RepID=UPI001B01D869|nr:TrkA family potassium uptake protein [uncultured Desulfovibrio sp.]MBO6171396.1 TrkA family potassium uptake protein [Desulfovibrio sp.]